MRASFVACLVALAVLVGCRSVSGPAVTGFEQDAEALQQYHRAPRPSPWLASRYEPNDQYPELRSATARQEGDRIVIRAIFKSPPEPLQVLSGPLGWRADLTIEGIHAGREDGFILIISPDAEGDPVVATRLIAGYYVTRGPATMNLTGCVLEASFDASLLNFPPSHLDIRARAFPGGESSRWIAGANWRVPVPIGHKHEVLAAR